MVAASPVLISVVVSVVLSTIVIAVITPRYHISRSFCRLESMLSQPDTNWAVWRQYQHIPQLTLNLTFQGSRAFIRIRVSSDHSNALTPRNPKPFTLHPEFLCTPQKLWGNSHDAGF